MSTVNDPAWERVNDDTQRLDTPNGWIYRVVTQHGITTFVSTTFVPGPASYLSILSNDISFIRDHLSDIRDDIRDHVADLSKGND
jgi:hypothetical protein